MINVFSKLAKKLAGYKIIMVALRVLIYHMRLFNITYDQRTGLIAI